MTKIKIARIRQFVVACLSFFFFSLGHAERIVSIGPSASSIIQALGDEDEIVAADSESMDLLHNHVDLKDIGYMRALSIEGIVALRPTVVIADSSASPVSVIQRLSTLGIHVVMLEKITQINSVYQNVKLIGSALNREGAAKKLINQMKLKINHIKKLVSNAKSPSVAVLLALSSNKVYMLGKGTNADKYLSFIQAKNAVSFVGMRPVSKEGLLSIKANVVLVAKTNLKEQNPYPDALKYLASEHHSQIHVINAKLLDSFGSNFADHLGEMAQKVYSNNQGKNV
ncbi:heme/hemin ABC transporter substrate-binding protein [Fangia hongkongensis]|uniref:heme/hemin ABC transporter substrate-binding protein n=1 Tax=Fangia hongkongensis TaxID=270495 RepID=UPI0003817761|nr:ABC transporter substrate-binding protein [Fangia hongkongensis]MBK2125835.1 ABC transporter substrate-binding protein [Fangia hongkongensis]